MVLKRKQNQRKLDKAGRRWFRRFAKRAAARKYRRQRILGICLMLFLVIYLAAAGYIWKFCVSVSRDKQIEYIRTQEDKTPDGHRELYRFRFSPKNGEITIYREQIDE